MAQWPWGHLRESHTRAGSPPGSAPQDTRALIHWEITLFPKRRGGAAELPWSYPGDARGGDRDPPGGQDGGEPSPVPTLMLERRKPVGARGGGCQCNARPGRGDPSQRPPAPGPLPGLPGASCAQQQQRRPGSPSLAMAGTAVVLGAAVVPGRPASPLFNGRCRACAEGGGAPPGAAPASHREGPGTDPPLPESGTRPVYTRDVRESG